jgi:hypothetical protein
MIMVKLLVPDGAPCQARGGESSTPSQVNSFGIVLLAVKAGLLRVRAMALPPIERVQRIKIRLKMGLFILGRILFIVNLKPSILLNLLSFEIRDS